ncbi:hotdog family protein [Streptosporangium saharense]|uniref:acyl dehydratase n=1 Tax=Streptosporangium saharense TaxID=1706840 RepID=UPI00369AC6B3
MTYRQQDDESARRSGPPEEGTAVGTVLPGATIALTPSATTLATPSTVDITPLRRTPLEGPAGGPLNILTTMGLVERYVTDWAGPEALVRGINVKLGLPAQTGETLVLTGTVVSREGEEFTVRVLGAVGPGEHVSGTVRLAFPDH